MFSLGYTAPMRLSTFTLTLSFALLPNFAAADDALIATGRALFAVKCQECHGSTGEGGASGDIRGSTAQEVARAARGFEQMPPLALNEAEIGAIVVYLRHMENE